MSTASTLAGWTVTLWKSLRIEGVIFQWAESDGLSSPANPDNRGQLLPGDGKPQFLRTSLELEGSADDRFNLAILEERVHWKRKYGVGEAQRVGKTSVVVLAF